MDPLLIAALVFAVLAAGFLVLGVAAFRGRRPLGGSAGALVALLCLAVGALFATLSVATRGYRALTREEVAARVRTVPTGPHAFRAIFQFPDSSRRSFRIRGDQIYVDARIVKWEPVVNVLGLHTAYELDRVAGRYADIGMERDSARTVHRLGPDRSVDLFRLVEQLPLLERIVDAEYGSATFVPADTGRRLEVRVSTSGLLMREAAEPSR